MSDITILLVDDHPVVREGYRRLLEQQPSFVVCAEAEDAAGAYSAYQLHTPDVVIMDLSLQGAGGLKALCHILEWDKQAKILIFTMHLGSAFALKAFEGGAMGYVTKGSKPSELIAAVETISNGGRFLSEDISKAIAADQISGSTSLIEKLSPRETEILRLLASGLSSDAVADLLNLSHKTIRNHHYTIKSKIGARNDAHLVWIALSAGLVEESLIKAITPSS